jgi:flagellar hook-basal body complex protein FliE
MNEFSIQNNIESRSGTSLTVKRAPQPPSGSFGQVLMNSLNRVNQLKIEADADIENLASGRQGDIHQTMIAVEKASVSFELLMQIRNKLITAYDKIMRMPV